MASKDPIRREDLRGTWAMEHADDIPPARRKELTQLALEHGLESAESIRDREIPLFNRGQWGFSNSGTFLRVPFLRDMRELGGQDVAFVGVPLDTGTTFRSGTRWGPEAMRRISSLSGGANLVLGVDLVESLTMVDVGDVSVIPANIEKSFDQIDKAIGYIIERGVFPVVLGGDHSIGYPDIRGLARYIDGNVGIIHFDRHSDLSEYNMDERMHGTPFFHATNIPNAPPTNLVQIGIGGWTSSRDGLRNARERKATVITIDDIDRYGIERICEYALEIAWKNARCVYLSFDIDCMDPAFAPGTGTPEPGGLLPREVFQMLRLIAREGLVGMEVVEVSPPYDVADVTSLLGTRVIMEVLGTLVLNRKLGRIPQRAEAPGEPAVGSAEAERG
ncbi:Guanidinobutyrase [bacterium HR26]|nr:Guanidinobutyrase [bacterium HR26]